MKTFIDNWVVFGLLSLLVCIGCSDDASVTQVTTTADSSYIVKARSVGDYQIGKSSLDEIMGSDTPKTGSDSRTQDLTLNSTKGKYSRA